MNPFIFILGCFMKCPLKSKAWLSIYHSRGCFFAQTQISDSDSDSGHGCSEACAAVGHTFDVLDYTNMLIEEGTIKYP